MDRSAELWLRPGPQCGGGQVGRVQRHMRSPLHRRPEAALTAERKTRHPRNQERQWRSGPTTGPLSCHPRKKTSRTPTRSLQIPDPLSVPLYVQFATQARPSARIRRWAPPGNGRDVPFVARKVPLAAVGGRFGDRVLSGATASPHNAIEP